MKKRYYYLTSLFLVFIIPSFIAGYFVIDHISIGRLVSFILLITLVGSLWDLWATRHGKHDPVWLWNFNRYETLGVKFGGLPIEEYLFYIAASTYIIFIWEIITLASANPRYYLLIPALGIWTAVSLILPFRATANEDKLIG